MERKQARSWIRSNANNFRDPQTGEVNYTQLAEECAANFDADNEGGPLDDPDHWIWDEAAKVA
jgi:hypothetical protein